ncbi:pentapeptide repeat-containing protein [Streptomyces sp. NBC_00124]|uniref:pentapeptide repeat-containing protein n=1 Tax=Streptomyces sp. NBC_00124 TaxID=2975662 RepID=UPI002252498D|nr:pentapeptide repeat-containing protein [Streptomyces sp. NBC_00124]MCX5357356.1 pentapeptide repeat-containing protein [Streptomyces sp. NBC_00124]
MTRGRSRSDRVRQLRRIAERRQAAAVTQLASAQAPGRGERWTALINPAATSLTALAAVAALLFTGISSLQARDELSNRRQELDIAREGQVTERFTAAVTQLGDPSPDVRLGGIYALERIMRDSPKDQRSIVGVLSAYIRAHCGGAGSGPLGARDVVAVTAAATAVAERRPGPDDEELVNWSGCLLADVSVEGAYLPYSDLSKTKLSRIDLYGGDLSFSDLSHASLDDVSLGGVNFTESVLTGVDLTEDQPSVEGALSILQDTNFARCDLTRTNFSQLGFAHIDFRLADLTDANLSRTKVLPVQNEPFAIGRTSFEGATLANTNLDGADLREAHGLTVDQLVTAHITPATRLPAQLADNPNITRWATTQPWKPSKP